MLSFDVNKFYISTISVNVEKLKSISSSYTQVIFHDYI